MRHAAPRTAATRVLAVVATAAVTVGLASGGVSPVNAAAPGATATAAGAGSKDSDQPSRTPRLVQVTDADAAAVTFVDETTAYAPARDPFTQLTTGDYLVAVIGEEATVVQVAEVTGSGDTLTVRGDRTDLIEALAATSPEVQELEWTAADIVRQRRARGPLDISCQGADENTDIEGAALGCTATITLGDMDTVGAQGTLGVNAGFRAGLELRPGIFPLRLDATASYDLEAELFASLELTAGLTAGTTIPGPSFDLKCVPLAYGAATICPTLGINLGVDAKAAVGGKVSTRMKAGYGASLIYENGRFSTEERQVPFQRLPVECGPDDEACDPENPWGIRGAASFRLTPLATLELHYLDHSGPGLSLSVGPFVEARADTSADPWWEIGIGAAARFGASGGEWVDAEWESDYYDLVEFEQVYAPAGEKSEFPGIKTTPPKPTIQRNQTVQLAATGRKDGMDARLVGPEWRVVGGRANGTIGKQTGLYKAPARAGTYQVLVKGDHPKTLDPASSGTLITVLPDRPAAPVLTDPQPGLLAGSVLVSDSTDDGGAPLVRVELRDPKRKDNVVRYAYRPERRYWLGDMPAKRVSTLQARVCNGQTPTEADIRKRCSPWTRSGTFTPDGPFVIGEGVRHATAPEFGLFQADQSGNRIVGIKDAEQVGAPLVMFDKTTGKTTRVDLDENGQPLPGDFYSRKNFSIDPTGRWLAMRDATSDRSDVVVRDLDTGTVRRATTPCRNAVVTEFLLVRAGIVFYNCHQSLEGDLYAQRPGGEPLRIARDTNPFPRTWDVSADGTRVVALSQRQEGTQPRRIFTMRIIDLVKSGQNGLASAEKARAEVPFTPLIQRGDAVTGMAALSANGRVFAFQPSVGTIAYSRLDSAGQVDAEDPKSWGTITYPASNQNGIVTNSFDLNADGSLLAIIRSPTPDSTVQPGALLADLRPQSGVLSQANSCPGWIPGSHMGDFSIELTDQGVYVGCPYRDTFHTQGKALGFIGVSRIFERPGYLDRVR